MHVAYQNIGYFANRERLTLEQVAAHSAIPAPPKGFRIIELARQTFAHVSPVVAYALSDN